MTNEELLVLLNAAIADARAAATNANAAANTANAAANQNSAGSAAGVAGARTQSNVEDLQVGSDINVPEAWSANVKRTYDIHQSYDMESMQRNRLHFDAIVSEQTKHLSQVHALNLQSIANNQNQSNLNNTLSIDRSWNVNETDAFATTLAGKIAETLFAKAKATTAAA